MSNAGAGMAFVIRGDVTRSPAVRSGTVARPTPTHPSGLHLEAVHGRPKATDDRRTALVAEAWPGTDATSTNDQVEKVADEVAAPAGMQADEATDISKGDSDARSEGTGSDHVVARVAAPSSRPAMAAPTSSTFRCALANDGSLLLMRTGDEPIDLSPSDTRAPVTYLRKLEELSYPRIDETDLPSPLRTQAQ